MLYPITDLFNRIRNAQAVKKPSVDASYSKLALAIAKILQENGFIRQAAGRGRSPKRILRLELGYDKERSPAVSGLKVISKPGQRIYRAWRELKKVKGGYGIAIVSTSKGMMTDKEARRKKLGGEVIGEVW